METKNSSRTEERRLITILFADLSGFSALSSKLDPEEVCDVANTCFEYLNSIIIKHGGTIHKKGGDENEQNSVSLLTTKGRRKP